jgi:HNH endonuclease
LRSFIGVTDYDWFFYLSALPGVDEVNFWQPGGSQLFQAINTGEPFLFKLHSPRNYVVGGGFFAHSSILPLSLAWDAFGEKNGAQSLDEMRRRIEKYRRVKAQPFADYKIGCILLEQPFFFKEIEWIPVPADWSRNIVQGKRYDLDTGLGKILWDAVQLRLQGKPKAAEIFKIAEPTSPYGSPVIITPRLGQGSFRIMVTDAYERRCAVTQERTLPALEAAHIKPFKESGPHAVSNGILLRSDIHKLFDNGYVTITPEYRFEVSRRIKEEFENGRDYYALNGRYLHLPPNRELHPSEASINWHNEKVFRT